MLLEYNSFIKNDVIIQVINGPYWDFVLNEELNNDFIYYNKEKKILLTKEQRNKLISIEDIVEKHISDIVPIQGKFTNEKTKHTRIIDFTIKTTEHWFVKFLRKEMENPNLINPEPLEGINLIANNIDEITRLIDVCLILDKYRVLIKHRFSNYSEIGIFEKNSSKSYNISLQTQKKGAEYIIYRKEDIDRKIILPPK